jgi:hypothetical protein
MTKNNSRQLPRPMVWGVRLIIKRAMSYHASMLNADKARNARLAGWCRDCRDCYVNAAKDMVFAQRNA